jgi:uncharacterized protein YegL
MVILSDGMPCCDFGDDELAKATADSAKMHGVEIFSVCIGDNCDHFQLKQIVSDDIDNHYFQPGEVQKLNDYVNDLVNAVCPGESHSAHEVD